MPHSLQPHGLYSPWNSLGQNTGVGSYSHLQEIFLTQGLNAGLLHCRQILYQLSHQVSPAAAKSLQSCLILCNPRDSSPPGSSVHGIFQARVLEWVAIAFSELMVSISQNPLYSSGTKKHLHRGEGEP